jgi:nucleotide-binding universal stress UspA family protein
VRRLRKPVLVTPAEFLQPVRIVAAYAAKDLGSLVLSTAASVQRDLDIPLEILTVSQGYHEHRPVLEKAQVFLQQLGCKAKLTGSVGAVARTIVSHTTPDTLLIMGAYGRSRVYHLILGSVTEQVLRTASGPVLLSAKPQVVYQ